MKITRNIITDLLPLYLDGEASPDTQALIEEFFVQEPEFAQLVQAEQKAHLPDDDLFTTLSKETEMVTLEKTKKLLRQRSLTMAFGIVFTLWAVSFRIDSAGPVWMWSETPIIAVIFLIMGLAFWAGYFNTARRLNESGL
jgi:hypothetical protein